MSNKDTKAKATAPSTEAVGRLARYLQHFPSCARVQARSRFPFGEAACSCGLDAAAKAAGLIAENHAG